VAVRCVSVTRVVPQPVKTKNRGNMIALRIHFRALTQPRPPGYRISWDGRLIAEVARACQGEYSERSKANESRISRMDADLAKLQGIADTLKLQSIRRHIFLCLGPRCCTPEQGNESWEYLKRRLKELGLADGIVNRTKAGCLRICCEGPTAVVYPEGVWYH